MTGVVLMVFFGITGLLLNHPEWTFAQQATIVTRTGVLPDSCVTEHGEIDFLAVSEYARAVEAVRGSVSGHGSTGMDGWITYAAPGLTASLHFDAETGQYSIAETRHGVAVVLGDIHRGVGTGMPWSLAIDAAAVLLIGVSLTGLGIEIYTRSKNRRRDLLMTIAGLLGAATLLAAGLLL